MLGRVTRDSIREAAGRVRGNIQHAYSSARQWGSMLDREVKVASQNYGAAQPASQDYAPLVEKKNSRYGEYDNIRERLVNENERAGNDIAHVRSKIPDLGLI